VATHFVAGLLLLYILCRPCGAYSVHTTKSHRPVSVRGAGKLPSRRLVEPVQVPALPCVPPLVHSCR
jgi:hypothetical protein